MSFDHQAFSDSTSLDSVASVNQPEQDRALFVGLKYESYYQAQFEKITPKKQYAGFNIAAFFLGVVWLFYRKMYSYGFMSIGLIVVIGMVEIILGIESSGANIGLAVAFGMFGNTLYKYHVDQQIAKIHQLGSGSVHTELENRGGTNLIAGSILLVMWLGLVALAISAS
ncbi:DUF2628 domain-containing protein [Acinetobacter johnsonii]|jgi:hypothetical protein|uniref:DUF2628 domain-containing protein n=1 Tax=Acinetobacter johnsonii TaxID=40214 RepID=UPI001A5F5060|nr:DUF2628 domain-containing protein [Acinetobacter johnsonii]MBL8285220.1 DUF2628 domain-containing protein [Acinetobacter johnsonii]MDV2487482.1 DUF2628 domain-containing protein [Acinetobacter johnsonii]